MIIAGMNLFEASVCVPDNAKVKGAGTAAIADLVGYQADNVSNISHIFPNAILVDTRSETITMHGSAGSSDRSILRFKIQCFG